MTVKFDIHISCMSMGLVWVLCTLQENEAHQGLADSYGVLTREIPRAGSHLPAETGMQNTHTLCTLTHSKQYSRNIRMHDGNDSKA